MESSDWKKLVESEASPLFKKINEQHQRELFDAESSVLRERVLPFYKDYKLLEATDFSSHPPLTMNFLYKKDDVNKIDGTKDSIFTVNNKADVYLNKMNVTGYVKFFLDSIVSEEGPFKVIETLEDVPFTEEPSKELLEKLKKTIKPVKVSKMTDDGYDMEAHVIYSRTLFKTKIKTSHKGIVDISDEKALETDLPAMPIMLL